MSNELWHASISNTFVGRQAQRGFTFARVECRKILSSDNLGTQHEWYCYVTFTLAKISHIKMKVNAVFAWYEWDGTW